MRNLLFLIMILVGLAHAEEAAPPSAGERNRVERLSADAADHYRAGRYQDASTLYEAAWAIFPTPGVLFNVARCREALGQWLEAADRYDRVAVDPLADPGVRARAAQRSHSARQRAATASAPPRVEAAAPPSDALPRPVWVPVVKAAAPAIGPEALRSSAWLLGGLGAASFITGGILVAAGASDHQDLKDARSNGVGRLTRAEAIDLREQGESRQVTGGVMMILGGAALVGAIVTLATVEPTPAQGRVSAGATGLSISF